MVDVVELVLVVDEVVGGSMRLVVGLRVVVVAAMAASRFDIT